MQYSEVLPDDLFSNHIESYWHVNFPIPTGEEEMELLLPTCTFNVIFTDQPCFIKSNSTWLKLLPGAQFFGQRSKCITIKSNKALRIYGVRFKPFAFSTITNAPLYRLNDEFTKLERLFELDKLSLLLIQDIIKEKLTYSKMEMLDELMYLLLREELLIDEKLRAQLNYIMERKGTLQISEILNEFSTSKVTLRKHFIEKVGLTPKSVSQIWRMNYLLQIQAENPTLSLTSLSLQAGFYDQSHFIKSFRQLFNVSPRTFFKQKKQLLEVAQHNISKRFTNQYDPR